MIKNLFETILLNYRISYEEQFANHLLAKLIRNSAPNAIEQIIGDRKRYLVEGSPGKGNWTLIPWIAIFDILVTESAQFGYYPVYLFRDDMSGFYLSLNQGVTGIERDYKADANNVLKIKSEEYRAKLGNISNNFTLSKIDLRRLDTTKTRLPKLYESGNIYAKFYAADKIPSDNVLIADLLEMLKIYETVTYNDTQESEVAKDEKEESSFKGYENLQKFRIHRRIERNNTLAKKVKENQGYVCKVCDINFEIKYGSLGKNFIEAHHLHPIAALGEEKIQLDIRTDFVVLCSNCHSMIHRLEDVSDWQRLRTIVKSRNGSL